MWLGTWLTGARCCCYHRPHCRLTVIVHLRLRRCRHRPQRAAWPAVSSLLPPPFAQGPLAGGGVVGTCTRRAAVVVDLACHIMVALAGCDGVGVNVDLRVARGRGDGPQARAGQSSGKGSLKAWGCAGFGCVGCNDMGNVWERLLPTLFEFTPELRPEAYPPTMLVAAMAVVTLPIAYALAYTPTTTKTTTATPHQRTGSQCQPATGMCSRPANHDDDTVHDNGSSSGNSRPLKITTITTMRPPPQPPRPRPTRRRQRGDQGDQEGDGDEDAKSSPTTATTTATATKC
ncbi:hypothetical protein EDB89DRAFT_1911605 [Lactarius sanguifluus]|nr:hypothetical protein EDB89DRAFT_1911605 [Lactarius sanguifluus]